MYPTSPLTRILREKFCSIQVTGNLGYITCDLNAVQILGVWDTLAIYLTFVKYNFTESGWLSPAVAETAVPKKNIYIYYVP